MYIYDIQYVGEDSKTLTRFAQYCPPNTDVSAWLKRIVNMMFDATGNKITLPGTNITVDISHPESILIATST